MHVNVRDLRRSNCHRCKKQISLLAQFDSLLRYALNMEIFVQIKFRHIANFLLVKLMQYTYKVKS